MKRLKEKVSKYDIKECTPVFYKNCVCCEYQYKRESLWKIELPFYTSQGNVPDILYICKNCMPIKNDLEQYIENNYKERY